MKNLAAEAREFGSNATTHGLLKISTADRWYKKLSWIIIFLIFFTFLVWNLNELFTSYRTNSSYTTIQKKSLSKMDFPAVTICNTGIFLKSKVYSDIKSNYITKHLGHGKLPELSQLRMVNLFEAIKDFKDVNDFVKSTPEGKHMFINKLETACMFGLDKFCRYPQDFKTVPVSPYEGNCFTFNHNGTFKQESHGSYSGLSLMMFINQSNLAPLISMDEGGGVSVALHDQGEFPFPLHNGILLNPGTNTRISLRKSIAHRLKPPYPSQCSNGNGIDLIYPGTYTTSNCKRSCLVRRSLKDCDAIDAIHGHYMNQTQDKLSRKEIECVLNTLATPSDLFEQCECPVPCKETYFNPTTSFSTWPSVTDMPIYKKYFAAALDIQGNITNEYVKQNFLKVNIFFEDLSEDIIQEKVEWTLQKLISAIGGQMGICIGASLFSLVELIVFLSRLIGGMSKKDNSVTHPTT